MNTIIFLIVFPLVVALALLILKDEGTRKIVVYIGSAIIAAASIFYVFSNYSEGSITYQIDAHIINYVMMAIEVCLATFIVYLGIKHKKYLVCLLAIIQTPLLVWFELGPGHSIEVMNAISIDKLSMIMILIIGIIGTLICVYAVGYMKDFQHHHKDEPDRRPLFFFLLFLFLAAMFGIVVSNNLVWMYFFWEITTLCSFLLIGYTRTKEATNNAFRALVMNLAGGLGFALAIIALGTTYGTLELSTMLAFGTMGYSVLLPTILLAFAGITKAAQMPFNSWLLGAMVAPTPTSALLHSSTMVKAGVFLLIKLSPVLYGNLAGIMVFLVGGITFLMASFAAISQTNGKKVLAYSTIANLGLIVACAGVGTTGSVWAGTMLIIFHAITKSLLFLCVGTAEHTIGSKDIESMDGLFNKMPTLAAYMMVGIAGMFLAPFGMLVSKWATMVSFVETGNIILIMIICFGSAATAFYWTEWLGKLAAVVTGERRIDQNVNKDENGVQLTLVVLTILAIVGFPFISQGMIVPFLATSFGTVETLALSVNNMVIVSIMVAVLILMFAFGFGRSKKKIVPIYLSGTNKGDNKTFESSMHEAKTFKLRNWHMEAYFGERKMNIIGGILSTAAIVVPMVIVIAIVLGGVQ